MEAIIAAVVTGTLTLLGTIITVLATNKKTEQSIKVSQAITDTKLEALTAEVREHNNFARRMPVVENDIKTIYKRIDKIEQNIIGGKS